MTSLSPMARAFVEQTVQSAALQQQHRAQIWAKLQRRVAAESVEILPVHWRFWRGPLGWISSIAAVALSAGILGAVHRTAPAASVVSADACPSTSRPSCDACVASTVLQPQPQRASAPAVQVVAKQKQATRTKATQRATHPIPRSVQESKRPDPVPPPTHRLARVLPAYDRFPLTNSRDRLARPDLAYVGANVSFHAGAIPFGGGTESLETAPPFGDAGFRMLGQAAGMSDSAAIGAHSPKVESRFEFSQPLKLTPPRFRLTAMLPE